VIIDTESTELPEGWCKLIEALALLAEGQVNADYPLHCEHDILTVMSDPATFTTAERDRLEDLGFHADDSLGTFYSFLFGSA
jgi:hypothetical protein